MIVTNYPSDWHNSKMIQMHPYACFTMCLLTCRHVHTFLTWHVSIVLLAHMFHCIAGSYVPLYCWLVCSIVLLARMQSLDGIQGREVGAGRSFGCQW